MKQIVVSLIVGLMLSGCASNSGSTRFGWIQGQITSISDGVVLPMQIQKKWVLGGSAAGGIVAQNPKSGEHLEGQYVAMLQAAGTIGGAQFKMQNANAQATLVGDKGTTISFEIQIMAGLLPHGFGQGTDGSGRKYSLQF